MSGAFPSYLQQYFEQLSTYFTALRNPGTAPPPAPLKLQAFHGHREILYAVAKFLGLDLRHIRWPGLPSRAIPASTTFLWELHRGQGQGQGDGGLVVKTFLWLPSFHLGAAGEAVQPAFTQLHLVSLFPLHSPFHRPIELPLSLSLSLSLSIYLSIFLSLSFSHARLSLSPFFFFFFSPFVSLPVEINKTKHTV